LTSSLIVGRREDVVASFHAGEPEAQVLDQASHFAEAQVLRACACCFEGLLDTHAGEATADR
jgi:hypothetical protein